MEHRRYLTIQQREALQRLLRERADVLRLEIGEDRLADLNVEPEAAALARDVVEFREVEAALSRLHEPDFGLCADCGSDIPYARLQAAPSASRCLSCQARAEHRPARAAP
ncbi:MAG: TraR/DksA C4-type zinc finger protein [Burkholderiales bacterium]|nr:TraR/DksA C4-type zinc finger protein [Burkholderiales bacterium]